MELATPYCVAHLTIDRCRLPDWWVSANDCLGAAPNVYLWKYRGYALMAEKASFVISKSTDRVLYRQHSDCRGSKK